MEINQLTLEDVREQVENFSLREGIKNVEDNLEFPQLAVQFSGVPEDENSYFNTLYELGNSERTLLLEDVLDKKIDNQNFQNLQKIYIVLQENPKISMNRIVAFMQGMQLLPETSTSEEWLMRRYIHWLEKLKGERAIENGIDQTFKRILTDAIKWGFTYLQPELRLSRENWRTLVWYKSTIINESQRWFIELSLHLGFDVVYIDISKKYPSPNLPVTTYKESKNSAPFPTEKIAILSTVARKASTEFNALINQGSQVIFKPYQFKNANLTSLRLQTTYDELKILGTSNAYVRPAFQAESMLVTIPTLFAKVNGLLSNEADYWQQLKDIKNNNQNSSLIYEFPIIPKPQDSKKLSIQREYAQEYAEYRDYIFNADFTANSLIESMFWPYNKLPTGAQLALANNIVQFTEKSNVILKYQENQELLKAHLFSTLLKIPDTWMKHFQATDYPKKVPKIIAFLSDEVEFTREDAILLSFMNRMGFDIILYNPLGQNDIENFISEDTFDIHWLENLKSISISEMLTYTGKKKTGFLNLFN